MNAYEVRLFLFLVEYYKSIEEWNKLVISSKRSKVI